MDAAFARCLEQLARAAGTTPDSVATAQGESFRDAFANHSARYDLTNRLDELCHYVGAAVGAETLKRSDAHVEFGDLITAFACSRGEERALQVFENLLKSTIPALIDRGFAQSELDELAQAVRVRLLVRPGPRESPRILQYRGTGRLGGFIRTAVLRLALNRRRSEIRRPVLENLEQAVDASEDPSMTRLKNRYSAEFRQALKSAWDGMEETNLLYLRHQLIDGLTIDEVANLYDIHRSTAARRTASARDLLCEGTLAELQRLLSLTRSEVKSVLRLIHTQLSMPSWIGQG